MNITRTHVVGFIGLVAFAGALYWAKAEAQSARERVVALQSEVDKSRRDVRTLEAEVAWLERPDRIEATAREKMALVPVPAQRTRNIDDLDAIAPLPVATPAQVATPEPATPSVKGPAQ